MAISDKIKDMKAKAQRAVLKKMIDKQYGNQIPEEQKEMIINAYEAEPEFFINIAKEIQEEVKAGKDQTQAAMEIMRKYQAKMQEIMTRANGGKMPNAQFNANNLK